MVDKTSIILKTIEKPQEAGTMLSRTLEKIKKNLRKEGFNQGVQVGIQKGIQKGMKDGLLRGVMQERINIAKKLLKHGMDERSILKITKLRKSQLDEIKKNK